MSISSHKQKTKKNSFQRKVQALQLERDELREKLLEYESELAGQIERFNSAEQEYKSKIYRLERKLQLQRHEETPILQTRIMNWIFFGVVCSILPLVRDRRKVCVNDKKGQYEKQRLSQEWK